MSKKFCLIFFAIFLCFNFQNAFSKEYREIYNELQKADFEYIFGIDPYQSEDYLRYYSSPYPLLRLGVEYRFKDIVIPRGYYLLTPREKNGQTYILFKQGGKVLYVIPIYKKDLVEPLFYTQHVPSVKKGPWTKFCDKMSNMVGRVSKQSKRTPPPSAWIEANEVDNEFWEFILYYGTQKYYLLFLKE